jgi:GTP-binding protein HflX
MRLAQERVQIDPAYYIGRGKLAELKELAENHRAGMVIFDENLSPAQLRNLERALGCKVIDRTQLILDIFARRARTKEGKLQVEFAQLEYLLPRLAGKGVELSRLGGGIGTRGPGETKLESDQRKIRRRLHTIKEELERVRSHRRLHRSFRHSIPIPVISLVGYTNAGKSTLFNALTGAHSYASHHLFATLDPLLRRLQLPSGREVVLSDTVGFIHKLPHSLISAFRATLEEVCEADLLLHVIDVSNPAHQQQREAVHQVLEELKVSDKSILEVHNKIDLLSEPSCLWDHQRGVLVSAAHGMGLPMLLRKIDELLTGDPVEQARFVFQQTEGAIASRLHTQARLIRQSYRNEDVLMEVEAPRSILERFRQWEEKPLSPETATRES